MRARTHARLLATTAVLVLTAACGDGAVDPATSGPDAYADPLEIEGDGVVVDAVSGVGSLDHVLIASEVYDVEVVAVTPIDPAVDDDAWPTATVRVVDALGADDEHVTATTADLVGDVVVMRTLSHARLEVGSTYRVFVNELEGVTPSRRISYALEADGTPAPGYDDPAAEAALERLVAASGRDATGALLAVMSEVAVSPGGGPLVAAMFGVGPAEEPADVLQAYLSVPAEQRSLPQLADDIPAGFEDALGIELVQYEIAVESVPDGVEALALHFPEVGLLGWSHVPPGDELFGVIGLGPRDVPFEVLARVGGDVRVLPVVVDGVTASVVDTTSVLAAVGDDGAVFARADGSGSLVLEPMDRLAFDERVEELAVEPSAPEGS